VQEPAPFLDQPVELASTALAELVGRAWMEGLAGLARQLHHVVLVLCRDLAEIDALLTFAERFCVSFHTLAQTVGLNAVFGSHFFDITKRKDFALIFLKKCRQTNINLNIFSILTFRPPLPARPVLLQYPPSYLTYSSAWTPSSDPASRGFSSCTRRASRTWACWHICSPF